MRRLLLWTCLLLGSGVSANVAWGQERPELVVPTGAYRAAWFALEGVGEPCPVFVAWREGKPVQFWSTRSKLPGVGKTEGQIKLLTDVVRGDSNRATIELRLVSMWAPIRRLALQSLTLDFAGGTWSLVSDGKALSSGTLAVGESIDAPIAVGADWPSYWGTAAANAGPDYGRPFLADLAEARPLWRSEATNLNGWGSGADSRYNHRAAVGGLCGGASSPVLAGGVVYLYSYMPSGDVEPEGESAAKVAQFADSSVERDLMRRWFSKRADLVVTATDASTGRLLWKSVWPKKQGNYQTHKWRGANPTPAVAKGVLVVGDYSWGVHAYDARTGELKWSRGGGGPLVSNSAPVSPVVVGDVVVWVSQQETVGLDLGTGRELWKAPPGESARRMVVGGKERALIVGTKFSGETCLIDPVDGRLLWRSDVARRDGLYSVTMPVCAGDTIVTYADAWDPATKKVLPESQKVVAYQVSDAGIRRLWDHGPITWDENLVMAIQKDRVFVAAKTPGLLALELSTGKRLAENASLKAGSNAGLVVVDDRLFYQPEGQHGSQWIHLVDAHSLQELGAAFRPRHNDATAYGQMAIANVIVDGRLIVRGIDGIYCYDFRKEKP